MKKKEQMPLPLIADNRVRVQSDSTFCWEQVKKNLYLVKFQFSYMFDMWFFFFNYWGVDWFIPSSTQDTPSCTQELLLVVLRGHMGRQGQPCARQKPSPLYYHCGPSMCPILTSSSCGHTVLTNLMGISSWSKRSSKIWTEKKKQKVETICRVSVEFRTLLVRILQKICFLFQGDICLW